MEWLKNNIFALAALLISLAGFFLSLKNYIKGNVSLKLFSFEQNNIYLKFTGSKEYRLIILDLSIENNSSSPVDVSRIKLISDNQVYYASNINIEDRYNKNGISLLNDNADEIIRYNISSENILNNTRINSYGKIEGFATFIDVEPLLKPKSFKLVVDTPSKSFSTKIVVNFCKAGFNPSSLWIQP